MLSTPVRFQVQLVCPEVMSCGVLQDVLPPMSSRRSRLIPGFGHGRPLRQEYSLAHPSELVTSQYSTVVYDYLIDGVYGRVRDVMRAGCKDASQYAAKGMKPKIEQHGCTRGQVTDSRKASQVHCPG